MLFSGVLSMKEENSFSLCIWNVLFRLLNIRMLESKSKKKTLTIKKPLKTYTYALNGTCRNTNYTPKYLRLSKIKYIVYGDNHGVYQKSRSNYMMLSDEDIDSAKLYLKNDSTLDLIENAPGYSFMGAIDPDQSNYHMDLSVLSGEFYDQAEWTKLEIGVK